MANRAKVLIAAFGRSLRDPFVHARNAALMALAVTCDSFTEEDCAFRILPAICPCLIDKEKLIRDQANKTMDIYHTRVRKHASTMPETVLPPPSSAEVSSSTPRMGTPHPNEAASWAGWAISSFTNKLSAAHGEITTAATNGTPSADVPRSSSAPLIAEPRRPPTTSASALHRQAVTSPPPASTRTSISSNTPDYFQDASPGEPEDLDVDDAWGNMEEDNFFDAPSDASKKPAPSAAHPFEDDGEPDFAGWLAAQSGKKSGAKPLPKGLAKGGSSAVSGRPGAGARTSSTPVVGKKVVSAHRAKPAVAKKIDTAVKDTGDDDDGWGDGW